MPQFTTLWVPWDAHHNRARGSRDDLDTYQLWCQEHASIGINSGKKGRRLVRSGTLSQVNKKGTLSLK